MSLLDQARNQQGGLLTPRYVMLSIEARDALVELADAAIAMFAAENNADEALAEAEVEAILERLRR